MLIEVVISALLVGLIAIGTLSGFESANRAGSDQRAHAQGTQLAQQDEERLRGKTTTELAALTAAGPSIGYEADNGFCIEEVSTKWQYAKTENKYEMCNTPVAYSAKPYTGTPFTVTSSAQYASASKEKIACETSGATADYVQTTSSVTWPTLVAAKRPSVTQSSVVTNSVSGLLVKVFDQYHLPVSGAEVTVTGEAATKQTTGITGCVTFLGIAAKTVEQKKVVEVTVTDAGFVDRAGNNPPLKSTVTLSPNSLSTEEFIIGKRGAIEAEFVSEIGGVMTPVESDTFYAAQSSINPPPADLIGGKAETIAPKVTLENLFPFAKPGTTTPESYIVYAGDCEKNSPAIASAGAVPLTAQNEPSFVPGATAKVKLEVPEVNVKIWEGTKATPLLVIAKSESARIINKECENTSAQRYATGAVPFKTVVKIAAGILEPKYRYQPYAKELELCVVAKMATGKFVKNTFAGVGVGDEGIANTKKTTAKQERFMKSNTFEEKAKVTELAAC